MENHFKNHDVESQRIRVLLIEDNPGVRHGSWSNINIKDLKVVLPFLDGENPFKTSCLAG
jgi:hypothetical protein